MKRIRPSFTVLSGAAIGLIAGASAYGAVSTASAAPSTTVKAPKTVVAAPAVAARCAPGQELEDGVCIVHVVKTVVVPAPSVAGAGVGAPGAPAGMAEDRPAASGPQTEVADDGAAEEAKGTEDHSQEAKDDAQGEDAQGEMDGRSSEEPGHDDSSDSSHS